MSSAIEFSKTINGFKFVVTTTNGDVELRIRKLTETGDSLNGLLTVKLFTLGKIYSLYAGNFNVLSSRTRKTISNYLSKLSPFDIKWDEIIEAFVQKIIDEYFKSEPAKRIAPKQNTKVEYLLYPLLPKNHPTLIYAPGGVGKSFLAMFFALHIQNGIPLFKNTTVEKGEVLYLDWEVDFNEASRRFSMLKPNFVDKVEDIEFPLYKRCNLKLKDELEDILEIINDNEVKFVIIDSAAMAVGGAIIEAQKVIEFFSAVRQITNAGATVMILTHVSKMDKQFEDEKSPIGSVFFENLTRLTWEIKSDIVKSDDDVDIIEFALFPRKSNFGKMRPFGYKAVFDFENVYFYPLENKNIDLVGDRRLNLVVTALKAGGATFEDLKSITGLNRNKLERIIDKLQASGKIQLIGEKWHLTENIETVKI